MSCSISGSRPTKAAPNPSVVTWVTRANVLTSAPSFFGANWTCTVENGTGVARLAMKSPSADSSVP